MDTLERTTHQVPARPRWRYAAAGVIAALVAIGVGELAAGLVFSVPSPVVSVADLIIEMTPSSLEQWAIRTFGTADKLVLLISIGLVATIAGVVIGILARVSTVPGIVVIWGFAALALYAMSRNRDASGFLIVVTAAITGLAGTFTFRRLIRAAEGSGSADSEDSDRRRFLVGAGAFVALGAASLAIGRQLSERARIFAANRAEVVLPAPDAPLPPLALDANLAVDGIAPIITPTDDFYRIDTAISVPMVNLMDWRLEITGLVDRPYEISYDDILAMDLEEHDVTIACVSNQVGGDLIGTARWLGVPLARLLDRAAVRPEGTQLVGRSVDGFTVGFPTEVAMDGRAALLAVGMNGEPLPFEHGFPARMIVSGLYGFVSATKWLKEIELTTWDGFDAYWIPRGWSKVAPIKTQSRIDTPRSGARVAPGPVGIGGVAWAQNTGIDRVEVQIDDGDWQVAELGTDLSINAWRQWTLAWDATAGPHTIRVRATDATGATQTADVAPPRPDGATGYHEISVSVA